VSVCIYILVYSLYFLALICVCGHGACAVIGSVCSRSVWQYEAHQISQYTRYWWRCSRVFLIAAVYCSLLQTVAVCFVVLQSAKQWRCSYCGSVLLCVALCRSVWQCVAVWCSLLQCVAVCCSQPSSHVALVVAVCCSVLQCIAFSEAVAQVSFHKRAGNIIGHVCGERPARQERRDACAVAVTHCNTL